MSFGRLERTPGSQPMSDINMTPLVDVMLVLVVILIITAPLLSSAITLKLPAAEGAQSNGTARVLSLAVDASGQVFFNDQPLTLDALALQLAQAAQQNPTAEVQLRADEAVPYGRIVQVMGLAQKVGLNRIGFVTDARPPAKP